MFLARIEAEIKAFKVDFVLLVGFELATEPWISRVGPWMDPGSMFNIIIIIIKQNKNKTKSDFSFFSASI